MSNSTNRQICTKDSFVFAFGSAISPKDVEVGQLFPNAIHGSEPSRIEKWVKRKAPTTICSLTMGHIPNNSCAKTVSLPGEAWVYVRTPMIFSELQKRIPDWAERSFDIDSLYFTAPYWKQSKLVNRGDCLFIPWVSQRIGRVIGTAQPTKLVSPDEDSAKALKVYAKTNAEVEPQKNHFYRLSRLSVEYGSDPAARRILQDRYGLYAPVVDRVTSRHSVSVYSGAVDHVGSLIINGYAVQAELAMNNSKSSA